MTVNLAKLLEEQSARAKKDPDKAPRPVARQRGAKKKARGGVSNPPEKPKAEKPKKPASRKKARKKAAKKPKESREILSSPEERYERFARAYIFGIEGSQPFNATQAYKVAYGSGMTEQSAGVGGHQLLKHPKVRSILARVAMEAAERHQVEEDYVIQCWLNASRANIFDYFRAEEDPERPGCLILKAHELNSLPEHVQQNVKKMKVTNRWLPTIVDGEPDFALEQKVEIELIDRIAVLRDIAKWRNMFAASEEEAKDLIADLIVRGQRRAKQKGVTIDGETGKPVP